ncbi:hypothetical protein KFL_006440010 [Klebsormidium nitens]|uniref:Uncharacterized protein n=1 Tax=Klebsormidium nitens TaxID=105231 RepID=A0A1Y1II49_KLENI|nr:hypothetical protein KFL_006440010 [Klebsormidium nitens]|eukprot:GAQ90474.1 hypothetical protein KFL_006440010 [Klebsormidium nitens]
MLSLLGLGAVGEAGKAIAGPFIFDPRAALCSDGRFSTDESGCIFANQRLFYRAGREIYIEQRFGQKGSRSTGAAVWEANLVLTRYMETLTPSYWKRKRVIELGTGTGFAAITAAMLGAADVTATDGDDRVLELAAKNFEANEAAFGSDLSTYLAQLRWGSSRDELEEAGIRPTYDVIVGADLTYYKDNIYPLVVTLADLSSPDTDIFLAHKQRQEENETYLHEQLATFFDWEEIRGNERGLSWGKDHPSVVILRLRKR